MKIRDSYQAGRFYPQKRKELTDLLESIFRKTSVINNDSIATGIVPHAGIIYSGYSASYFYKSLNYHNYDRIIIIGPSHYFHAEHMILSESEQWKTPLGNIDIDREFSDSLIDGIIMYDESLHMEEHSIEVQIPFIQYVCGSKMKIVPIIMGDQSLASVNSLAEKLIEKMDNRTLIIASSDMYHGYDYNDAIEKDNITIKHILNDDYASFNDFAVKTSSCCGTGCISTVLRINEHFNISNVLLNKSNSSQISGEYDGYSVGYAAFAGVKNV